MEDQGFRLDLDVDDSKVKSADQTVVKATADVYDFADAYEVLETELKQIAPAADRVTAAFKDVDYEMVMLGASADKAATQMAKVPAAAKGAQKGGMDVGNAALQAARGLEDFQYGIGGVVNNVPGLVMAMGGTMGLAAALNITMVVVAQLSKHWSEFGEAFAAKIEFAQARDSLHVLNDELAKSADRLKELEKQGSGSVKEMQEYVALVRETAQLEEMITKEKKAQADVKKLLDMKAPTVVAEEKARAKALEEGFAGNQNHLIEGALRSGDNGKLEALAQASRRRADVFGPDGMVQDQAGFQREFAPKFGEKFVDTIKRVNEEHTVAVEKERAKLNDDAKKLVASALIDGSAEAAKKLGGMAEKNPQLFPEGAAEKFGAVAPGFLKVKKADEKWLKKEEAEAEAMAKAITEFGDERYVQFQKLLKRDASMILPGEKQSAAFRRYAVEALSTHNAAMTANEQLKNMGTGIVGHENAQTVKVENAQEKKTLEGNAYVERAERMIAQLKAQGGRYDRFGRFIPMNDNQLNNFAHGEIARTMAGDTYQQLKRQGGQIDNNGNLRRMNDQQMRKAAMDSVNQKMVGDVAAQAQGDLANKMTALSQSGLNTQQRLVSIAEALNGQIDQMMQAQRVIGTRVKNVEKVVGRRDVTRQNSGFAAGAGATR